MATHEKAGESYFYHESKSSSSFGIDVLASYSPPLQKIFEKNSGFAKKDESKGILLPREICLDAVEILIDAAKAHHQDQDDQHEHCLPYDSRVCQEVLKAVEFLGMQDSMKHLFTYPTSSDLDLLVFQGVCDTNWSFLKLLHMIYGEDLEIDMDHVFIALKVMLRRSISKLWSSADVDGMVWLLTFPGCLEIPKMKDFKSICSMFVKVFSVGEAAKASMRKRHGLEEEPPHHARSLLIRRLYDDVYAHEKAFGAISSVASTYKDNVSHILYAIIDTYDQFTLKEAVKIVNIIMGNIDVHNDTPIFGQWRREILMTVLKKATAPTTTTTTYTCDDIGIFETQLKAWLERFGKDEIALYLEILCTYIPVTVHIIWTWIMQQDTLKPINLHLLDMLMRHEHFPLVCCENRQKVSIVCAFLVSFGTPHRHFEKLSSIKYYTMGSDVDLDFEIISSLVKRAFLQKQELSGGRFWWSWLFEQGLKPVESLEALLSLPCDKLKLLSLDVIDSLFEYFLKTKKHDVPTGYGPLVDHTTFLMRYVRSFHKDASLTPKGYALKTLLTKTDQVKYVPPPDILDGHSAFFSYKLSDDLLKALLEAGAPIQREMVFLTRRINSTYLEGGWRSEWRFNGELQKTRQHHDVMDTFETILRHCPDTMKPSVKDVGYTASLTKIRLIAVLMLSSTDNRSWPTYLTWLVDGMDANCLDSAAKDLINACAQNKAPLCDQYHDDPISKLLTILEQVFRRIPNECMGKLLQWSIYLVASSEEYLNSRGKKKYVMHAWMPFVFKLIVQYTETISDETRNLVNSLKPTKRNIKKYWEYWEKFFSVFDTKKRDRRDFDVIGEYKRFKCEDDDDLVY
jgi:hypothetical protein